MATSSNACGLPQSIIDAALPPFATLAETFHDILIKAQRYLFLRLIYRWAATRLSVFINCFEKSRWQNVSGGARIFEFLIRHFREINGVPVRFGVAASGFEFF
ncbi:hypothetical protein ASH09_01115 [Agrobacterium radiobacter]|nr:hypothetical protein ASH09_01115 [Agrobacterium radiobacter]